MTEQIKKFVLKISILSIIIGVATALVYGLVLPTAYLQIFPVVIIFFAAVSSLIHILLLKSSQRKANFFVNNFMMATMAKMFIYLIFVAVYIFVDRENKFSFIIFFSANYLIFTVFEISILLSDLRNIGKK